MASIETSNIPRHIAIIMDGNGRWAKKQGAKRIFGHQSAIQAVRDATEGCAELGVEFLTLYAFSTENWNRPKYEVIALMELLVKTIKAETPTLLKNNVKLSTIGDTKSLPEDCRSTLAKSIEATKDCTGMVLTLALSYSSRWDITNCVKTLVEKAQQGEINGDVTEDMISSALSTYYMPDPELLIRTSGEYRISNFLLWELAYTEIHIIDTLWPDFRKSHLHDSIINYQSRERRFGKTGEQIEAES